MRTGPHKRGKASESNPVRFSVSRLGNSPSMLNCRPMLGRRRRDAALMAVLATVGVWSVRSRYESVVNLIIEAALIALILLAACYFRFVQPDGDLPGHQRRRIEPNAILFGLAVSAIGMPCLIRILLQAIEVGGAWEMVWLTSFGVAAIVLALLSVKDRNVGLSVVSSGFLVLFAASSSDTNVAVWLAIAWAVCCLWWLVANHWERLDHCLSQSVRRIPMMRVSTTLLGLVLALATALLAWGRYGASSYLLAGFMPTSGGESYSDGTARSGVGDGDAMVAAREHASAFGAVDSDIFLESKQPSLFDMFDDTLGEPIRPKQMERAIALQQSEVSEAKQKPGESDQSGQTFSTARQPRKKPKNFENNFSGAALHWVGEGGAHLAMERLSAFDGLDWTAVSPLGSLGSQALRLEIIGDRSWFFLQQNEANQFYAGTEQQAVKVMRLDSARIPAPATVAALSITDVDRVDFFGLTSDGSLEMPGRETIPKQTTIRLVSRRLADGVLRTWGNFPRAVTASADAQFAGSSVGERSGQVGLDGIRQFEKAATAYIGSASRGWTQIELVVNRLRDDFEFDRQADCGREDPLLRFFNQRRGGDHMFATAASVMLRSLGYDTRLVLGFYVDPKNCESASGEFKIFKEDSHVWLEVRVADDIWVPVEPTPGYLQPRFERSLFAKFAGVAIWALPYLAIMLVLGGAGWYWRAIWGELACLAVWYASGCLNQRKRLWIWTKVLDVRCWLANCPRPKGVAQRRWLQQFCASNHEVSARLDGCFDSLDAIVFGGRPIKSCNWVKIANELIHEVSVGFIVRYQRESYMSSKR